MIQRSKTDFVNLGNENGFEKLDNEPIVMKKIRRVTMVIESACNESHNFGHQDHVK